MQVVSGTPTPSLSTSPQTLLEASAEPGGVAIGVVPAVAGVAAGGTVTLEIIRNDTAAVIASSVVTNSGAGAAAVGGIVCVVPLPAGIAGAIALTIVGSAAGGAVSGTVTLVVLP